jgi:hypothetical protein
MNLGQQLQPGQFQQEQIHYRIQMGLNREMSLQTRTGTKFASKFGTKGLH